MEPQAGLLADRYRLTSLIAGGGMGQVWRGHDTLLDRAVAVKVLRDQFVGDPTFLIRFRAEAQHAALLTHPNIAGVYDYGEARGGAGISPVAYLVMELVEGESLAVLLRREGALGVPRTLEILRQSADGLAAAHAAGVVHRDIKPGNLLVGRDGAVKLTDFGIARSAASAAVTGTGQVIGTAHYLSPEQAAGATAGPAGDVYALGVVGYECLTGRRVFSGEHPVQIAVKQIREQPAPLPPGIPSDVRNLVERAMAKDMRVRFADGAELRDAIDGLRAGAAVAPAPTTAAGAPPIGGTPVHRDVPPPRRRRPWVLALATLAGVVLVVAGVAALVMAGSTTPAEGETPGTTTPGAIEVVVSDLVGRPVQDVQVELVGLGLLVHLVPVETVEVPSGRVTGVEPSGALAPGDVVSVEYAVPPVPVPAIDEGNGDEGSGDEGSGDGEEGVEVGNDGQGGDEGGGHGVEGGG